MDDRRDPRPNPREGTFATMEEANEVGAQLSKILGVKVEFKKEEKGGREENTYFYAPLDINDFGVYKFAIKEAELELILPRNDHYIGRVRLHYRHGNLCDGGSNGVDLDGLQVQRTEGKWIVMDREGNPFSSPEKVKEEEKSAGG